MGWVDSGDLKVILLQGVIPLVVGISICVVGALVVAGIISFPCCKRHDDQIFPVFVMAGAEGSHDNDNSTTRGRAYGPVACKAQLYGMKPKERQAVLEAIFRYSTQKESLEKLEEGTADDIKRADEEDTKVKAGECNLDTRFACAICLRDYEGDDVVMTGTNCTHKFHKHCAMVWMTNHRRPKDHCPYCRKEMMTPEEMKKAAVDLLGEDRVSELAAKVQREGADNTGNNAAATDTPVPDIENDIQVSL